MNLQNLRDFQPDIRALDGGLRTDDGHRVGSCHLLQSLTEGNEVLAVGGEYLLADILGRKSSVSPVR